MKRTLPITLLGVAFAAVGPVAFGQSSPGAAPADEAGPAVSRAETPGAGGPNDTTLAPQPQNYFEAQPGPYQPYSVEPYLMRDPRYAKLSQPISVHMQDATLTQALQTLSTVNGLPITADGSVRFDGRLTIDARSVPLASVLEGIAQQANVMIARSPQGIVLRAWPSLAINGRKNVRMGPSAPWSDEWRTQVAQAPQVGLPGLSSLPIVGRMFTNPGGPQDAPSIDPRTPQGGGGRYDGNAGGQGMPMPVFTGERGPGPFPGMPGEATPPFGPYAPTGDSLTMVSLGEKMFVVAEKATGPKGEAGFQLTLYHLDADFNFRKSSTVFHRSANAGLQSALPGRPFGGGPLGISPDAPKHGGGGFRSPSPAPTTPHASGVPIPPPGSQGTTPALPPSAAPNGAFGGAAAPPAGNPGSAPVTPPAAAPNGTTGGAAPPVGEESDPAVRAR